MFRKLALGGVSLVAVLAAGSAAVAADLPAYEPAPAVAAPVPSFTWTGPYIGAQVGYGWGNSKTAGFSRPDPKGWLIGGYAGYNVEINGLVAGVETDFNWSNQDDRRTIGGARVKSDVNWAGATRGRIGYAFDRFLVYGAAGVAYADREISVRGAGKSSKTAIGWTVGGGVDTAITENVVARAEYRYTDYGTDRFRGVRSDLTEHRIMAGVAYKFNW